MAKGVPEASKSDFWSPKGEGSLEDGVGSLECGVRRALGKSANVLQKYGFYNGFVQK